MKALITGANGQLGFEFVQILKGSAIPTDKDTLDITDKVQVLSAPKCDIIINCSAYTDVDGAEDDEKTAYEINVTGAKNLTELAKSRDIPIIYISTDYVFDGKRNIPYTEKDKTNPMSVYGKTKLLGEEEVKKYNKHYIVRTSWLYGENGRNFVKTIVRAGREKGKLNVVSDQIGSPTNAKDLANQIMSLTDTGAYGVYHCTGAGSCSWYDFAQEIVDILKIKCEVLPCLTKDYKSKAKRPSFSVLSNKKIENITRNQMPNWKKSLKDFLKTLE